jgi:hypothetical protein
MTFTFKKSFWTACNSFYTFVPTFWGRFCKGLFLSKSEKNPSNLNMVIHALGKESEQLRSPSHSSFRKHLFTAACIAMHCSSLICSLCNLYYSFFYWRK